MFESCPMASIMRRLPGATDDEIQILSIPLRPRRSGREIRMLIDRTDPFATAKPDARLVKLLIKACRFNAALFSGDAVSFAALAKREGVSRSYFTRVFVLGLVRKLSNRLLIELNMGSQLYRIPYIVVVIDIEPIRERFSAVAPFLDERGRRLIAAAEAFAAGYGGIAAVAMATGIAPSTIGRGLRELAWDEPPALAGAGSPQRIRRQGAGRKPTTSKDPTLLHDLEALVEPTTRGDPESPLRWTCKSLRRLAQALQAQGHQVSRTLVGHLLNEAGYSLQGNRKTTEATADRDAQFGYINTQVTTALAEKQPVISVDTKKKELVGDFRNNGREYRPQGNPEEVRVHDFLIKELGRAVPYRIYDLAATSGWVSVGVDHDTAAFAVNSIRQW